MTRNLTVMFYEFLAAWLVLAVLHVFTVLSRAQEVNDNDTPIVRRYDA